MRAAPPGQPAEETFRPPLVSAFGCGGWAYASHWLYELGQQGEEWGSLGCLVAGGMAVQQGVKALNDQAKLSLYRRKQRNFKKANDQHGRARYGTVEDIAKSNLFSLDGGLFLGTHRVSPKHVRDVFVSGRVTTSIIGPPGTHKTTSITASSLLAGLNENILINDTCECLSICGPALRRAGYRLQILTPFRKRVSELLPGQDIEFVGLDICSSLHPAMSSLSIRTEVQRIMSWIVPDRPHMDEKSQYFYRGGRMIGSFLALYLLSRGHKPNLPDLRKLVMLGPQHLLELFTELEDSSAFGGTVAELARSLGGVLTAAPQQFAGSYGIIEQALDPYDANSELGVFTSSGGIDPGSLTNPDEKVAGFVVFPPETLEVFAPTQSMILTYLLDSIAANNKGGNLTAIFDECGALQMPKLATSLEFYRKTCNLRMALLWQDLTGQALKNYGKAALHQIMSASQVKIGMGLQEPETLEMFSKLCGTQGITNPSLNDRARAGAGFPDMGQNLSHGSVPLLRPEEIRQLPSHQMLVVGGNTPPLILEKVPYWTRPSWKAIAGPSPYFRG